MTVCFGSLKLAACDQLAGRRATPARSRRSLPRRRGPGSRPSRRRRPAPPAASPARESGPAAARRRSSARRRRRARCTRRASGRRRPPARRASRRARRDSRRSPAVSIAGCVFVVRSSCSFGPSWISARDVVAERRRRLVERLRAPPGGRPRRRACRRIASPGRGRRTRTASWRSAAQLSSRAAPRPR